MKKALSVRFEPTTRIVIAEDATEEQIIEAARKQMLQDIEFYLSGYNVVIEDDTEKPYDPQTDEKPNDSGFIHPELKADFGAGLFNVDPTYSFDVNEVGGGRDVYEFAIWGGRIAVSCEYTYDREEDAQHDARLFMEKMGIVK